MPNTGFITVGQAAKALKVSRQRIHQLITDKQINGVVWMLEKWAVPEAEIKRIQQQRKHSNGNGNRK